MSLLCPYIYILVGTRDFRTLWGALAGPARVAQVDLVRPSCPVHPHLARWTHCLAPNCITHSHWMYKRPWHLAWPPAMVALATIRECLWHEHTETYTTFTVCKRHRRMSLPLTANATQRNVPAPSLLELQRERRETTKLGYPGRCRRQPRKHTGLVPVHPWQRAWFMVWDLGLRGETAHCHRPG
jgi:hypothetical protein